MGLPLHDVILDVVAELLAEEVATLLQELLATRRDDEIHHHELPPGPEIGGAESSRNRVVRVGDEAADAARVRSLSGARPGRASAAYRLWPCALAGVELHAGLRGSPELLPACEPASR